ncbi:hypothetical protein F53441_6191 [Fusarium austroafricanum]|uniref:Uncharacterized protein n=1 Tax=Fusarium austroafricanum TaxID=2364996 RepID=A0A8H4KK94_9HYPO|nr:hypothetical protein F53441_6191 [Fusarium austroafricanum]
MSALPSLYDRNMMKDENQVGGTLDPHLADSSAEGSDPNPDEPESSESFEDDNSGISNEEVNNNEARPLKRRRERHRNPVKGPPREEPCLGCYRRMADKGPSHPCLEQSSILAFACYDCARIGRKCIPANHAIHLGCGLQEAALRTLDGEPDPNWEDLARKAKRAIRNYVPDGSSAANTQRTGPEFIPQSIAPAPPTLPTSAPTALVTLVPMAMPSGFPPPRGIATPQSTPAPQSAMVPRTAQQALPPITIPRLTNLESLMTRVADSLDLNNRLLRQLIVDGAQSNNRMMNIVHEIGTRIDDTNRLAYQILREISVLIGGAGPDLSSFQ